MQKSVNYIIKLLDKISLKTELSVFSSSGKDRPASVFILHILISFIQKNPSTHSPSLTLFYKSVICKSTCQKNYIPAVILPLNPTSLPSTAATLLATRLMAVLQPSGYSVFHGGDTPIQLSLP